MVGRIEEAEVVVAIEVSRMSLSNALQSSMYPSIYENWDSLKYRNRSIQWAMQPLR